MLNELLGIPAHPLVVHAAVVFVPLLVLAGVLYALIPKLRGRIGWVAVLLAVVGPLSALLAMRSGDELAEVLTAKNYPPQILDQVAEHQEYGESTLWFSLGLGAATGLLIFVTSGNRWVRDLPAVVRYGLAGLVVVLGVVTAYYVFKTGDTGSRAVWTGVL
ncbi:MAG TPA: DUF2231 domain-containing protein [Micromonosporaceae bacterium]|nr:DUF2231 domain-containing protein [Micromonosporaceae bacterium]